MSKGLCKSLCTVSHLIIVELTQQQTACGQGPAHLDVMDLHVLTGDVLHWDLLRDLGTAEQPNIKRFDNPIDRNKIQLIFI